MKLVIDINEKDYNSIISDKLISPRNLNVYERIIANGTLLEEELEKIKGNIQFIAEKCLPNNLAEEFEIKGLKTSIEIIDRRISELKGE